MTNIYSRGLNHGYSPMEDVGAISRETLRRTSSLSRKRWASFSHLLDCLRRPQAPHPHPPTAQQAAAAATRLRDSFTTTLPTKVI